MGSGAIYDPIFWGLKEGIGHFRVSRWTPSYSLEGLLSVPLDAGLPSFHKGSGVFSFFDPIFSLGGLGSEVV